MVLLAQHLEACNLQDFWAATNSCKDTIKQGARQHTVLLTLFEGEWEAAPTCMAAMPDSAAALSPTHVHSLCTRAPSSGHYLPRVPRHTPCAVTGPALALHEQPTPLATHPLHTSTRAH